jgi:hypothetical protein
MQRDSLQVSDGKSPRTYMHSELQGMLMLRLDGDAATDALTDASTDTSTAFKLSTPTTWGSRVYNTPSLLAVVASMLDWMTLLDLVATSKCVRKTLQQFRYSHEQIKVRVGYSEPTRFKLVTDAEVGDFLTKWPGIRYLDLEFAKITNTAFLYISKLQNLHDLDIQGSCITDVGFTYVSTLTSLETLNLYQCYATTDIGLYCVSKLTRLKSLNVAGCCKITDVGFNYLKVLVDLVYLNYNCCPRLTIASLQTLSGMTKLRDLTYNFARTREIGTEDYRSLSAMTDMRSLSAIEMDMGDGFLQNVHHMIGLVTLNLVFIDNESLTHITDTGLENISQLLGLKTLHLGNCSQITDEGIKHLVKMVDLERLNLSSHLVTDMGLMALLSEFKKLKVLNLGGCTLLTDITLQALSALGELRELSLRGCSMVTDVGINSLASFSTKMRLLDLSFCHRITDIGVSALVGMSELVGIDLQNCLQLTEKCFYSTVIRLRSLEFENVYIYGTNIHKSFCKAIDRAVANTLYDANRLYDEEAEMEFATWVDKCGGTWNIHEPLLY